MPRTHVTAPRIAAVCGAALLGGGIALVGAPSADALAVAKDVPMAFPSGGDHMIRFGAFNSCHWDEGKGNSPLEQAMNANAIDLDVNTNGNFLDPLNYWPFNSATVDWENHATGQSGSDTVFTNGREVGVRDIDTGIGDLTVTITATRSAFPTFAPGSVVPFASATHTETFEVQGIDVEQCNGPIDGGVTG
ncbi:hypothetical protein [Dietzia sp.]|uniref:hypothetical protein n=1 Tax=Dietzia sp. TaxID=1871616 RepID=UPI002FDA01F8